ncbi:Cysteine protease atg4 [Yamadazyma tenuis]|nr:Cysteine protease atg4 [Yamadazyma tenuis]
MGQSYKVEDEFLLQVEALVWLTYRTGFEPIPKNPNGPHPLAFVQSMVFNKNPLSTNVHSFIDNENFTTDVGWGCMIRTSQSLLANTYKRMISEDAQQEIQLLDQFKDSEAAPFSLHNFIRVANESPLQVKPGQWFGPNAASLSIQRLCNLVNSKENFGLPGLSVLISENSDLYDDKVQEFLDKKKQSLLILLPIRLGIDKTNEFYYSSILQLLNCKQSVGIAGGKPSSSFYFFGYDNDELLYLDPHYPQGTNAGYNSYHTPRYQRLTISQLDPSMMIGILVDDLQDYNTFKAECLEKNNKIVHFAAKSAINEIQAPASEVNADFVDFVDDFDEDDIVEDEDLDRVS